MSEFVRIEMLDKETNEWYWICDGLNNREYGLWCEMTQGERKAFIIRKLVQCKAPSGTYIGRACYKNNFDEEWTIVSSKPIDFYKWED